MVMPNVRETILRIIDYRKILSDSLSFTRTKKEKAMKKNIILCMLIMIISLSYATQQVVKVSDKTTKIKVFKSDKYGLTIEYQIGEIKFDSIKTKKGSFEKLYINDYSNTDVFGDPSLPLNRKLIAVPINAEVSATVIDFQKQEIRLIEHQISNWLYPHQLSVMKSEDHSKIIFRLNENTYKTDAYDNSPTISVKEIGFMRGVRVFDVLYKPIRYNPVSNKLEVITQATIKIEFKNGDYKATSELLAKTRSPYFGNGMVINTDFFKVLEDEK